MTASGVSAQELQVLARQARAALAAAEQVTLLVDGLGPTSSTPVAGLLHEHNGHPRFICDFGSQITRAAEQQRIATLQVTLPAGPRRRRVLLSGRLAIVRPSTAEAGPSTAAGSSSRREAQVDVVALTLHRVQVDRATEAGRPEPVDVPIDLYSAAPSDALAEQAQRIIAHTNAAHEDALRRCVAAAACYPPEDVAGAWLSEITGSGARLHWVDPAGAHHRWLRFAGCASSPIELAALLRARLESPNGC